MNFCSLSYINSLVSRWYRYHGNTLSTCIPVATSVSTLWHTYMYVRPSSQNRMCHTNTYNSFTVFANNFYDCFAQTLQFGSLSVIYTQSLSQTCFDGWVVSASRSGTNQPYRESSLTVTLLRLLSFCSLFVALFPGPLHFQVITRKSSRPGI
jgi:hypothetical protein